jgi:hypothetical protein
MNEPDKKTFRYSLEIEEIPHTAETTEYTLGTDFYNPDFGEDCWAREILGDLFKDAMCQKLTMQMHFIPKEGDSEEEQARKQRVVDLNEMRIEQYRKLEKTLKLIKS